jgi:ABC-type transport system substrate-binding protein
MQRNFIATIVQTVVFLLLCGMVLFAAAQSSHVEELVLEGNRRTEELTASVERMRRSIESGSLTVAAAPPAAGAAGAGLAVDPAVAHMERYYQPDEWQAMLAEGNFILPRTDRHFVEGAVEGGTIRRSAISDIPGLNPLTVNAADVSELYHYITEPLATRQRNDPSRRISQLAYRIEVSEDYREYRVFLKKGVMWHRPSVDFTNPRYEWLNQDHELVADDFVFFYELVMDPQVQAAHLRNYYEKCEGIEVVNDHEFIVRWSETTYPSISFTLGMAPIPRWLYGFDEDGVAIDASVLGRTFNEHWYNRAAVGVGPYRFESWEQGGAIRLARNEDYHGQLPAIQSMEYRVIGDATARLNNLRAGGLDYITLEPTQYNNEITLGGTPGFGSGELRHELYQGPAYRYLGWNADGRFFNDRRVRQAMTYAFNRDLLLRQNFYGLGTLITGPFFIDSPDYNRALEVHPFDLTRAAALLDEAGWTDANGDGIREKVIGGETINFEFGMLTYGYRPEFVAAMEHYRNDLARIGVAMTVEPVEWAVMVTRMEEKDFEAYTGGWVLGWENDPYQIWHSSQADEPRSSNRVGFRNPEADRIIEQVRETFDDAERAVLLQQFHSLLYEEQPYTFFFAGREIGAWRSNLQGVNFSVMRPFDSSMNWYFAAP